MKPKHYLVHLVRSHPQREEKKRDFVREEIRKTLSAEQFTQTIKQRLLEKRKREALREQLRALELELLQLEDTRDARIERLRAHIEMLKKKVGSD